MPLQLFSDDDTPSYKYKDCNAHNINNHSSSCGESSCLLPKHNATLYEHSPVTKPGDVYAKRRFVFVMILSTIFVIVVAAAVVVPPLLQSDRPFSSLMMMLTSTSSSSTSSSSSSSSSASSSSSSLSYTMFQGLGFSIYTGGAPYYHQTTTKGGKRRKRKRNKECIGKLAIGHLGKEVNATNTTKVRDHYYDRLYCYVGEDDGRKDVARRLGILTQAVERAHKLANPDPHVLKIFNVPEFYWRGKDGAYYFHEENIPETACGEVCQILMGLETFTGNAKYQDWLFLFGTIITAERLPSDDPYEYVFLNFAPVYKGYDPDQTDHVGQRFLMPKRYVSGIDFLTPLRQHSNQTLALEIIENDDDNNDPQQQTDSGIEINDIQRKESEYSSSASSSFNFENDTTVVNPFLRQGKYSNTVWKNYRAELSKLEYTMIEYGWVVIDGVALTIEVCLDHRMATALHTYTADAVSGRKTLIPHVDCKNSRIEYKSIPSSMAQLSLVSSAGMTVKMASMAITNHGYVFLQDGLENTEPRMFVENDCYVGLSFEGGTELVSRHAFIARHDVDFQYSIHTVTNKFPVYDPRFTSGTSSSSTKNTSSSSSSSSDWMSALNGVFSTTMYEPTIVVYPPLDIPGLA